MKFSDDLWDHILPVYQEIVMHPFNVELADGTLSQNRFNFYMQQDAYYLKEFSRALALIAGRANSSRIINHFINFSLGALIAERELHAHFVGPSHTYDNSEPSLACMAYTRYLIATAATASLEEAIAAVLPCFWIYREVGRHIRKQAHEGNPYSLWINTYSSQEFSDGTDQAIAILDEVAEQCSANLLMLMRKAFEYCSLFEWRFWDDAYKMTTFRKAYIKNKLLLV